MIIELYGRISVFIMSILSFGWILDKIPSPSIALWLFWFFCILFGFLWAIEPTFDFLKGGKDEKTTRRRRVRGI